jgi:hypothetical protein
VRERGRIEDKRGWRGDRGEGTKGGVAI